VTYPNRNRLCVTISVLLLLFISPNAIYADKLDDYINAEMKSQRIAGLSLAVVRAGKVIKAKGYGLANIETNAPARPETVYKIASVSKQFLASGIMLLAQDGKIGLDDKIGKYLTGAPETWNNITIRHLLTHTSGIVRDAPGFDPYKEQTDREVIETAYPLALDFAPGEKWAYSNTGYYILAEIIQQASGKAWGAYLADRVFGPSGMAATRTTTVNEIVPNRANGYDWEHGRFENAETWLALRPSGAFISSVLDLAKWDATLYSDTVLTAASRKQMWTPAALTGGAVSAPYGFGWFLDSFQGHAWIHHEGGVPGFTAEFSRFLDDKLTVIVLANQGGLSLTGMALDVAAVYAPALTPPHVTLTASVLPAIVAVGSPVAITLTAKNGDKAAPGTIVNMEVKDSSGAKTFQQFAQDQNFDVDQAKTYTYMWKPAAPGAYTVDLGAFGANWRPKYGWVSNAASIVVK
jgi:D-alanyl-D-alanine carboxypeptidase